MPVCRIHEEVEGFEPSISLVDGSTEIDFSCGTLDIFHDGMYEGLRFCLNEDQTLMLFRKMQQYYDFKSK